MNHDFDGLREWYGRKLDATSAGAPGGLHGVDRLSILARDLPRCPCSRQGTRADGRPGRHLRHRPGAGQRDHRTDLARYADAAGKMLPELPADERFTFQITFPVRRLRRHGLEAVGSAQDDRVLRFCPQVQAKLGAIPGHRNVPGHAARAARRRTISRSSSSCSRPPNRSGCSSSRKQLQVKAMAERHVLLPADHRHEDRPAAGRDRDRSRQGRRARPEPAAGRRGHLRRGRRQLTSTASTSPAAATKSSRRSSAASV